MTTFPRRAGALAAVLAVSAAALAGCGSTAEDAKSGTSASAEQSSSTRTVKTVKGDVQVPANPQRVVVLNYALAGYLYDLDVPVTGTIPEDANHEGKVSDMWGNAPEKDGTKFLPWSTDGFDKEAIAALKPDLIVAGGWGFPYIQADKAYKDLSGIAPTVLVDKAAQNWDDQLRFIAVDVLGKQDKYDEMVKKFNDRVSEVKGKITVPPQPTSFLSVLADGTAYIALKDTALPELFEKVGFTTDDVAGENKLEPYTKGGDVAELSSEQLAQMVKSKTVFVNGFNKDTLSADELKERDVWKDLPAFKEGHAYTLPYWAARHDYDEALALLDRIEKQFAK